MTNDNPDHQDADGIARDRPDDCCCEDFHHAIDLPCWPCYREGFEEPVDLVTDGAGASPVDPDAPATEPYGDEHYDDRFTPGGGR